MTDPVVSSLIHKRAELMGELRQLRERMEALRQGLEHLDATIHLFDPGYNIAADRPKRPLSSESPFAPGDLTRAIFDALRTAQMPMTIAAITSSVIAGKGLNPDDRELVADVKQRVGCAVRKKANGVLQRVPMNGGGVRWSVAP